MTTAGARHLAESAQWLAAEQERQKAFQQRAALGATLFDLAWQHFSEASWRSFCLFYQALPVETRRAA